MKMAYLLTKTQMENQVKFLGPGNMSGASQQNSVAAFSEATEVDGDSLTFKKHKELKKKKKTNRKKQNNQMAP